MEKEGLIAIIIPVYNRAHLIGETLDSILAQTYQNWECIVVDDGSTDATEAVVLQYQERDARISYYQRPSHYPKGANACRNYGLEKSNGDYVHWFDSDDLMHHEKLRLKMKHAFTYQADVVVDTHSHSSNPVNTSAYPVTSFSSSTFYIDFVLGKKPVITNDVMLKRSIVGQHRFDEQLHKAQEYEFLSRVFQQALTYCFLEVALSFYRPSVDSISKAKPKKQAVNLIYLSKKLQRSHPQHSEIIAKTERQARKTYKSLVKVNALSLIFKNFHFFRKSYHKSSLVFLFLIFYNLITKKGFDQMKPTTANGL